ncbi:MAG: ComEC/Rec2 family competence protein, partial [Microgenomates group bacterium]
ALGFPPISSNHPLFSSNTYQIDQPEIKKTIVGADNTLSIRGLAINLRTRLLKIFNRVFGRPFDGIVAGVVLGDKSMIPPDFWLKLKQTGTLHIMVASGMNIAMFSQGMLRFFLLFFKRRLAICCLLVVIWFYSIMTGLTPPMIRAATLASLIYLGSIVGRETEGGRLLLLTGLLMIFVNPFLLFDVSFQLSFMAMAGLVWIQPILVQSSKFKVQSDKCRGKRGSDEAISGKTRLIRLTLPKLAMTIIGNDNFASSLASQIATLPILVLNFGQLNLASPLINLIILWTIPFILQLGMAVGVLGLLWIKLALLASYLVYPLLFFLEQSISLFAKITFFQVELPKIGWWWAIGYYLMLWRWIQKKDKNLTSSNDPLKSSKMSVKGKLKER